MTVDQARGAATTVEQYVYVPRRVPTTTKQVQWRYIAQRILGGEILSWKVPLTTEGPAWALSGPGALTGTVTPEFGQMRDSAGDLILQEWGTAIYAEADGQIRWGGIVIRSGFNGPEWAVEAAGFTTYPTGITYTGDVWERISQDPMGVVAYLWDHVQSQPDGDIGMQLVLPANCPVRVGSPAEAAYDEVQLDGTTEWIRKSAAPGGSIVEDAASTLAAAMDTKVKTLTVKALSNFGKPALPFLITVGTEQLMVTARSGLKFTVTRGEGSSSPTSHSKGTNVKFTGTPTRTVEAVDAEPYTLTWWDSTDVGGEIDTLAQETPFDYTEEHTWGDAPGGTQIIHRLVVSYPRAGRKRTDLAFVQGANITSVVPVIRDGDEYANTVFGLGKGEGAASLRAEVAVRDGRLRRTAVFVDKTVETSSRLSALTRSDWQRRQIQPAINTITVVDHPNARIGSWSVGDDILVKAQLPWIGYVEVWSRIIGWQLNGETRATLTLQRSDTFTYGQAVEPPPLPEVYTPVGGDPANSTISPPEVYTPVTPVAGGGTPSVPSTPTPAGPYVYTAPHISGAPNPTLFLQLGHLPKGMGMGYMSSADWDPLTGEWFQAQEDDGDALIHRWSSQGTYMSTMRLKDAGHANQIAVERTGSALRIWLQWETPKGATSVRRIQYGAHTYDINDTEKIANGLSSGRQQSPALDQENDTICLRMVSDGHDTFKVYRLSDMVKGKLTQLGKTVTSGDTSDSTYQGHAIGGDSIYRVTNIRHRGRESNTEDDWHDGTDAANNYDEYNWRTGAKLATRDYRRAALFARDARDFRSEPEGACVVMVFNQPVLVGNWKIGDGDIGDVNEQRTRLMALTPVPTSGPAVIEAHGSPGTLAGEGTLGGRGMPAGAGALGGAGTVGGVGRGLFAGRLSGAGTLGAAGAAGSTTAIYDQAIYDQAFYG